MGGMPLREVTLAGLSGAHVVVELNEVAAALGWKIKIPRDEAEKSAPSSATYALDRVYQARWAVQDPAHRWSPK
jgi:hypothetical protein